MNEIRLVHLTGDMLAERLDALAALRIEVFRAFPYLYDGSPDYERRYLQVYAANPQSVIVGALDGDRLVGAATAVPLAAEPDALRDPLARAGYEIAQIFYCGASVLLPEFRGRGIGVAFFREREAFARSLGKFTHCAFCGAVRSPDDPRRPAGFVPLDGFWRNRGYAPVPGALGRLSWREIGAAAESEKPMQFWIKPLA